MKSIQSLLGCIVGKWLWKFEPTRPGRSYNCIYKITAVKVIVFLLLGVLTGCTLINPHIKLDNRPPKDGESGPVSVDAAIAYGNEAKKAYRDALGDEAIFRNVLGIGLIVVATAIPIMAITQATTKEIGIVGVSGAGLFALGTWLQNTPRQRAYVQGYNAVNCAIEAVAPLNFGESNTLYNGFVKDMNDIVPAIDNVRKKINDIRKSKVFVNAKDPDKERAEDDLKTALQAVDEAEAARRSGIKLQLQVSAAGPNLVTAIDRIVSEVDLAIIENQPDLSALSSIIGGIGQMYGQLTALPPGLAPDITEEVTAQAETLDSKLSTLKKEVAKLSIMTRRISDFVNQVIASKPGEKLRACGVDPEQIATDILIDPPQAEFAADQDSTKAFIIRGGRRPFRVTLLGAQSTDINVSQPDLFGPAFVVQVKSTAKSGPYSIYAADGSGRQRILQIQVGEKGGKSSEKKEDETKKEEKKPTPGGTVFKEANITDRKNIQRALCYKEKSKDGSEPDGLWGENTRKLLIEYQETRPGDSADGTLTVKQRDDLLRLTPNEIQEKCVLPSNLKNLSRAISSIGFKPIENDTLELNVQKAVAQKDIVEVEFGVTADPTKKTPEEQKDKLRDQIKAALLKEGKADSSLGVEHIKITNWEELKGKL